MNPKWKKRAARKTRSRAPSKALKKVVQQMVTKNVETKVINVPETPGGTSNSVCVTYGALAGIQYLAQDVFRLPQGAQNSSAIGAANRIGDKVKGVGFLMDYYFHAFTAFNLGGADYRIPFVKLRITVFKTAFGSPLLSTPLVYDSNYLTSNTSTLQPINYDEGYVKDVLYDRVHVIKASDAMPSSAGPTLLLKETVCYHFKKFIKYPNLVRYCDNNTTSPNSTTQPIYIAIAAEVDDAASGLVPSGSTILTYTGFTKAQFKDA